MFSEPHRCPLSALLLVADLPLRSRLLTKFQEPSELSGHFLCTHVLGSISQSATYLVSMTSVLGNCSKQSYLLIQS